MSFDGFSEEGLTLLSALGEGDRAFFHSHKKRVAVEVMDPAKALVDDMAEALRETISTGIVGQAKVNGSISPLNNDLRFNPERSPYKDHLLLRWWEGQDKKTAPTLWLRVSRGGVGFATGRTLSTAVWREAVAGPLGESLAEHLARLGARHDVDVAGAELKRVPKPYTPDHPRSDLLRHKQMFQVRWSEPAPAVMQSAGFVAWCARRLEGCADIHRWLGLNL